MTPELLVAIVGVVASLTALVVQTSRLLGVAEHYMIELRKANEEATAHHRVQETQGLASIAATAAAHPTMSVPPPP